jgi:hypothetical protein
MVIPSHTTCGKSPRVGATYKATTHQIASVCGGGQRAQPEVSRAPSPQWTKSLAERTHTARTDSRTRADRGGEGEAGVAHQPHENDGGDEVDRDGQGARRTATPGRATA